MGEATKRQVWWIGASQQAPQDELDHLKDTTQGLEEALNATRMRMAEIEKARMGE